MIAIQYRHKTIHAVNAAGGPSDGSLYGFRTLCGMEIRKKSDWTETDDNSVSNVTCVNCRRVMDGRHFGGVAASRGDRTIETKVEQ